MPEQQPKPKLASQSRTIKFNLLSPFIYPLVLMAVMALNDRLGLALGSAAATQVAEAVVALLVFVAGNIYYRFQTSDPVVWALPVEEQAD